MVDMVTTKHSKKSLGWVVAINTTNVAHCALYNKDTMEANSSCLNSNGRQMHVRLATEKDKHCKRCTKRRMKPFLVSATRRETKTEIF